jgi:hypothetical protein
LNDWGFSNRSGLKLSVNEQNSWEVDSYEEGQWKISVRHNMENDRVDEGDHPEPSFRSERVIGLIGDLPTYNIYMNNQLVAEIRGDEPEHRQIIPMRGLSKEETEQFYQYLDENHYKAR